MKVEPIDRHLRVSQPETGNSKPGTLFPIRWYHLLDWVKVSAYLAIGIGLIGFWAVVIYAIFGTTRNP